MIYDSEINKTWKKYYEGLTVGEIKNKKLKGPYRSWYDFVKAVNELKDDEYTVIPKEQSLLPMIESSRGLVHWDEVRRPQTFHKVYKTLELDVPTEEKAISEGITPRKLINKALNDFIAKPFTSKRGISWRKVYKDGGKERIRIYSLVDCYIALKMLASLTEAGYDFELEDYDNYFVCTVPSRKDISILYETRISSPPWHVEDNRYFAEWLNLEGTVLNKSELYGTQYREVALPDTRFHFQKILSYWVRGRAIKLAKGREKREVPLRRILLDPFVKPTKQMFDFGERLNNNVLREYIDERKRVKVRKLNKAEMENSLWLYVHLYHKPKEDKPAVIVSDSFESLEELIDYIIGKYPLNIKF